MVKNYKKTTLLYYLSSLREIASKSFKIIEVTMFYDYKPIYCNDFKRPRNLCCIRINVHHGNYKWGLKNESLYKFS